MCNSSSRRERSKVPLIVRQCVEEIERRGMKEVGLYRVSGVMPEILALKAAFDSSKFGFVPVAVLLKATFVSYDPADHCLLCRQQGRVCHDEGDGRERHHRNAEAVFP